MNRRVPLRTVHCWGDSLTAGYGAAPSEGWTARLARRFPAAAFHNHGVCGALFSDILSAAEASSLRPAEGSAFFLMGGTNDILCGIRFEALLAGAERGIRALSGTIPLLLGVPLLTTRASIAAGWQMEWQYEHTNETLRAWGDFLRGLAADLSLPLIDFEADFPAGSACYADGVHPNGRGYAIMADTAARVFAPLLEAE